MRTEYKDNGKSSSFFVAEGRFNSPRGAARAQRRQHEDDGADRTTSGESSAMARLYTAIVSAVKLEV